MHSLFLIFCLTHTFFFFFLGTYIFLSHTPIVWKFSLFRSLYLIVSTRTTPNSLYQFVSQFLLTLSLLLFFAHTCPLSLSDCILIHSSTQQNEIKIRRYRVISSFFFISSPSFSTLCKCHLLRDRFIHKLRCLFTKQFFKFFLRITPYEPRLQV